MHVQLVTRNLIDRTAEFPAIAAALARLPAPTLLLDGEIVLFDAGGVSRFQLFGADTRRKPVYVVFDVLFARGQDLRARPLAERRKILEQEVPPGGPLRLARRLAADGFKALELARARGLEGIVAKDPVSPYDTGKRSMAAEGEGPRGGGVRDRRLHAPAGARSHSRDHRRGFDCERLRYAGKSAPAHGEDAGRARPAVPPARAGDATVRGPPRERG